MTFLKAARDPPRRPSPFLPPREAALGTHTCNHTRDRSVGPGARATLLPETKDLKPKQHAQHFARDPLAVGGAVVR